MKVWEKKLETHILDSKFVIDFEEKPLQWFGHIKRMNRIRMLRNAWILNVKGESRA
jgi:hypothetical protein